MSIEVKSTAQRNNSVYVLIANLVKKLVHPFRHIKTTFS